MLGKARSCEVRKAFSDRKLGSSVTQKLSLPRDFATTMFQDHEMWFMV